MTLIVLASLCAPTVADQRLAQIGGADPGRPPSDKLPRAPAERLARNDVVQLFAVVGRILDLVRTDYIDPADEGKLLRAAIRGMQAAFPAPARRVDGGQTSAAYAPGGRVGLNELYDAALDLLNARPDDRDDARIVKVAVDSMFAELDSQSSYMDPKSFRDMQLQSRGDPGGLGIEVTKAQGLIKVVSPIEDGPAEKAGLVSGDEIVLLDGEDVRGMTLNEAVDKMRGPVGSKVTLRVVRNGRSPVDVQLIREVIRVRPVKARVEAGDIGYIRIAQFNEETAQAFGRALSDIAREVGDRRLKGYIVDLRNNSGGLLDQAVAVSDELLDRGEIVALRGRRSENTERFSAKRGDAAHGRRVMVLINAGSAAASEIVAGALQDHKRATIVGTRSAARGSIQTIFPLGAGGGVMRLTTARFYTPSGRSIQTQGVWPDIEVLQDVPEELNDKMAAPGAGSGGNNERSAWQTYVPPDPQNDKALRKAVELLHTASR